MVYAPQRRHAVSSITLVLHTTAFMQYLYSPNFLIVLSRALIQQQIIATPVVHPTRSLFGLAFILTMMNSVAVLLHWLDFLAGMNGGKGIILDFVGQSYTASLTRVIVLDLILYLGQLVTLVLTFVTGHANSIPASDSFPYPDPLLPPEQSRYTATKTTEEEGSVDDVESGLKQRRRRGFESAFEELDTEQSALWLNDDGEGQAHTSSSSRLRSDSNGKDRIREPPIVFSLTLPHIFHLIFALPNPLPPPAFAGGTPMPTPPITPGPETRSPLVQSTHLAAEEPRATTQTGQASGGESGDDDRPRHMPGDYRERDRPTSNTG